MEPTFHLPADAPDVNLAKFTQKCCRAPRVRQLKNTYTLQLVRITPAARGNRTLAISLEG